MLSKLSKIITSTLLLLVCLSFYSFAAGQKDLTKKPPGYGILVIGNDGKLTAPYDIRWIYEIKLLNDSDGKQYSINIPDRKKKADFYYLPPGKYRAIKRVKHHFYGSESIADNSVGNNLSDGINYTFTITEGAITIFQYYLYRFNNNKKTKEGINPDVENYILPSDYINKFGTKQFLYLWDYNPETIQYLFFIPFIQDIERIILTNLLAIKGADQWLYKPQYVANNSIWPNIPKDPEPIIVKKEVEDPPAPPLAPWSAPELKPLHSLNILAFGIDTYNDMALSLSSAGSATIDFANLITQKEQKFYKSVKKEIVTGAPVTKSDILFKIHNASVDTPEGDTLLIYIASQGISDIKGRPYIIPSDGDINSIPLSCLPIKELISTISGKEKVFLILDTGRKGPWMDSNQAYFSYDSTIIRDIELKENTPLALYCPVNGLFTTREGEMLSQVINNSSTIRTSLLDKNYWESLAYPEATAGIWLSNSSFKDALDKDEQINIGKEKLVEKLRKIVNSGTEEESLAFIGKQGNLLYLSKDDIKVLTESIIQYFKNIKVLR